MGRTTIEWTRGDDDTEGRTWNPVTGCTKLSPASPGCEHCYAASIAERFRGGAAFPNGFDVQLREHKLTEPLGWQTPSKVFVNSMSDIFHPAVPDAYIVKVFAVMALTPRQTYLVLTKRHGRMRSLLSSNRWAPMIDDAAAVLADTHDLPIVHRFPLDNVWLGVSTENQSWADIRVPALLDTPAAVRFISAEPLLGPINLSHMDVEAHTHGMYQINALTGRNTDMARPCRDVPSLDWVIVGGESGSGARPMHPDWARSLRDQCVLAGVPFFFKQQGAWTWTITSSDGEPEHWVSAADGGVVDEETALADGGKFAGVRRVGKKRAGRLLDGRLWEEYPQSD